MIDLLLPRPPDYFLARIAELHTQIRRHVWAGSAVGSSTATSEAGGFRGGDWLYPIDLKAEQLLERFFSVWGEELPVLVFAEGFSGDGGRTYTTGTDRNRVAFTCVVDPIDGTRG